MDWEDAVELRLTYQGLLLGATQSNTRAKHKHEIRRQFHPQLRRFWATHPALKYAQKHTNTFSNADPVRMAHGSPLWKARAEQFARNGYNFVPLVSEESAVACALEVLFLRADIPGVIIRSGDLDNRIKTLFDSLRMPKSKEELGGYDTPSDDENPFFVLLEDDKLITQLSVETDALLQPVSAEPDDNDARLVITINLRPHYDTLGNSPFS